MAHGASCHCMMCTVGKKMGMISDEQHHNNDDRHQDVCKRCNHSHNKEGLCNCGCK